MDVLTFVCLHNAANAPAYQGDFQAVPYSLEPKDIEAYFKSMGAQFFHLSLVDSVTVDQLRGAVLSTWKPSVREQLLNTPRWIANSGMFILRHLVFMESLHGEQASGGDIVFTAFIYQREDNVYFQSTPMNLAKDLPMAHVLSNASVPIVIVDMFCGWGSYSDKIYLANVKGANIVFCPDLSTLASFFRKWIIRGLWGLRDYRAGSGRYPFQTEIHLKRLYNEHRAQITQHNFTRTEMRYNVVKDTTSTPRLCIPHHYVQCTSPWPGPRQPSDYACPKPPEDKIQA